jgi:glycosyltransferase involved in cell wall biosynthesis/SAM-dependent methyltransferase
VTLRVCLFGTYDRTLHPRIANLQRALESAGAEVIEVHEPAWPGRTEEKIRLARNPLAPGTLWRLGRAWIRLARAYRRAAPHDVVLVGYFGHLDVFLARLLAGRDKVVLDLMLSVYDTVALDRRAVEATGVQARLARALDRLAVRQCRRAFVDTPEHAAFFVDELGIPAEKLAAVPVGADDRHFVRAPVGPTRPRLRVLFFGTFVPLQGTTTVAAAIGLVGDAAIDFTIVGHGQDRAAFDAQLRERPGSCVIDWVDHDELPALIAGHDIVLGIFGATGKARRVIPNKVYQAAAVGRAVVTGDTPAARDALGDDAVLVPVADAAALAAALVDLAADRPRVAALSEAIAARFDRRFSPSAVGAEVAALLGPDATLAWTPAPRWLMRLHLLRELIGRLDSQRPVVELGYGSGAILEVLSDRGFRATGLDMSASAAVLARARMARIPAERRPEVLVGDLDRLDSLRGTVGALLMFEVLEHVEDDVGLLRQIHGLLGADGSLVLSVPAHQASFSRWDEMAGHFRRYDRDDLMARLRDTGFEPEVIWCYGYPVANALSFVRRLITPAQGEASSEDLVERSAASGNLIPARRLVGALVSERTMLPFSLLQRPFLRTDLGDGYLVMARKVQARSGNLRAP